MKDVRRSALSMNSPTAAPTIIQVTWAGQATNAAVTRNKTRTAMAGA